MSDDDAPAQVRIRIPAHLEPITGFVCFQRRGVPGDTAGHATCTCCGARLVLPHSWSRLHAAGLSPTQ